MSLESAKNLGAVGALLLVIAGIGVFGTPFVGLLGIVGIILVLIGLKGMSDYYKEAGIFNNSLYALITIIVGAVAFIGTIIASVLMFLSSLPSWMRPFIESRDWTGLASALQQHFMDFGALWTLIGVMILALVVLLVFAVVAMFFLRRSLVLLSAKTHVGLFGTAGLLMLIGAVLTVIVIGLLLIWIGWILLTVAFFSVRIETQTPPTLQPPQPPPQ